MAMEKSHAVTEGPRRDDKDLVSMVLGGLWPVEASVEALLDRLEAREAAR